MSFTPRALANGNICCSNPAALCDTCKAHHAHLTEFDPPDIYTAGVAQLRIAQGTELVDHDVVEDLFTDVPRLEQPRQAVRLTAAESVDADPYADAIAAMRASR